MDTGLLAPLSHHLPVPRDPSAPAGWVRTPSAERSADSPIHILSLCGIRLGLHVENAELAQRTMSLCGPMATPGESRYSHPLRLDGLPHAWRVSLNSRPVARGSTANAAALAVLHRVIDLACQAEDRLLVVHGAGLVMTDARGLLLIGAGGSGKTTLACALNAEGLPLLSDDVVPVTLDGNLLGLNTPLCLKAGSGPVLARYRPDLALQPDIQRFGQDIRYLPPRGSRVNQPIRPGRLLFPRYQPDGPASLTPISPEAALQGLVEAEAVIRDLTQAKLAGLARWVATIPAWSLRYPDLDSGLAQVRAVIDSPDGV